MEATASQRRIVSPITPSRIIVAPTDDPTRASRRALERFQKICHLLQKQNCGLFRREHFLRVYWIKYYAQGKPIRENTRSRDLRTRRATTSSGTTRRRASARQGGQPPARPSGLLLPRTALDCRRYAIVSDADLQETTRRLTGTIPGTNAGVDGLRTAREAIQLGR